MAAARPYASLDGLIAAAELAFSDLRPDDWLAAFAAHPRIGESGGHSPATSAAEQRRVTQAPPETLRALADENREYEARFGHVFLIAAAGRGADEIRSAMRERMRNDPETELRVAAAELRKIARLRLVKLVST